MTPLPAPQAPGALPCPAAHAGAATPAPGSTAPWYVCLTKPRLEPLAAERLQAQGYEVWLPMLPHWVRHAGAWRCKQSVMFPRYAFVRPGHAQQGLGPVRSTPGVSTLVSFGHVLATLSADRVEALRAVVAERAAAQPDRPLQPGRQVVFCSGPLKGLTGIVSAVAAERVLVMMSLLGREQAVTVQPDALALA